MFRAAPKRPGLPDRQGSLYTALHPVRAHPARSTPDASLRGRASSLQAAWQVQQAAGYLHAGSVRGRSEALPTPAWPQRCWAGLSPVVLCLCAHRRSLAVFRPAPRSTPVPAVLEVVGCQIPNGKAAPPQPNDRLAPQCERAASRLLLLRAGVPTAAAAQRANHLDGQCAADRSMCARPLHCHVSVQFAPCHTVHRPIAD